MTSIATVHTPPFQDFLIREAATGASRSGSFLAASTLIEPGLVLGLVFDPGRVAPFNPAASDGSEVVYGIALQREMAGPDRPGRGGNYVHILSHDATVVRERLIWPDGATAEQIAAGLDQLATRGIVAVDLP